MIPLRLVIDTNILVSAAIKPDGLQRTVLLLATTKPVTSALGPNTVEFEFVPGRGTSDSARHQGRRGQPACFQMFTIWHQCLRNFPGDFPT